MFDFLKRKRSAEENNSSAVKIGEDLDFATKEAYNLLRTNLYFSFPEKTEGKLIGITSSCPQEGKSFTAINLSYVLAEAGNKVLLVDGDMRRPSIAKTLKKPLSPGLSNLLISGDQSVIHKGVLHENLSVVMAGDLPPNPSELISSEKMSNILAVFSKHFDYIILDLPPVNSVSDPIAVSQVVDGILVVLRHEITRRSDLQETIRQLRFAKARILGFVYNGFTYHGRPYYRKSHYYKDYKNYYVSHSSGDDKNNV